MSGNPNWSEFEQRRQSEPAPRHNAEFDSIVTTALTTVAGRELLKALRARYIDRPENPLGTEASLRVRVTQQQFVRDLEAAIERGLAARKAKPES